MEAVTLSNGVSVRDAQRATLAGMAVYDQAELDASFADMEHLLALERPAPLSLSGVCVGCGGSTFVYNGPGSGHPGSRICDTCGVVESGNVYWETMYGRSVPRKSSNYKRIHHWHERISQLLLMESPIPHDQMLQIGEKLCDGTHSVLNKDSVRAVLRSLNMQLYIEKWLQVIFRLTSIAPPMPGPLIIQQLDALFIELQRPFEAYRAPGRKNFLNYNYVFCRLFQKMDCHKFCMFFPLIKSKTKLKSLDDMWVNMVECIDWQVTQLQPVAPFAVRLEQPVLLLQRLNSQRAPPVPAVIASTPWKMGYQRWGRPREERRQESPKRPRSTPLEPEFQRLGLLKRRLK